jgi:isopenicillin N synthase-like dioxygenase
MFKNITLIALIISAFSPILLSSLVPSQEITQPQQKIPVLDLDDIYKDVKTRQLFIKQFGEALQEVGFVKIKNHHISQEKIEAAMAASKQFFTLPEATKKQYEGQTLNRGYRGYNPARADKKPDLQEYWHVGPLANNPTPSQDWPKIAKNIWPSEVDSFQSHLAGLYQEIAEKGQPLLAVASVYMGKETTFLSKITEHGDSVMRVVHYLPTTNQEQQQWKSPHRDPNLLTILVGTSAEGLEVQMKDGSWVNVPHDPSTITVSASNMLENLSNGLFRSAPHRVQIAPSNTSRYVIPFFYHVQRNLSIGPQKESILQTGSDPLYPDITAEQALKDRSWFEN